MRTKINNLALTQRLDQLVERYGGVRATARVLGVTAAYISRLRRGEKMWPDDKILKKLKVQRTVIYWTLDEIPVPPQDAGKDAP